MKKNLLPLLIIIVSGFCSCGWQIQDNREALRDGVLRVYVYVDVLDLDPEVEDDQIKEQLLVAARERGKMLLESLVNHYVDLPESRIVLLRELPGLLKEKGALVRYNENDEICEAFYDFEITEFAIRMTASSVELGIQDDTRKAEKIREETDYEQPW